MQHPKKKHQSKRKTRKSVRHPGICRHAEALGLNRNTLYRYLTGIWEFPEGTRRRYEQVLRDEAEEMAEVSR